MWTVIRRMKSGKATGPDYMQKKSITDVMFGLRVEEV